jgi:hypothetical protein
MGAAQFVVIVCGVIALVWAMLIPDRSIPRFFAAAWDRIPPGVCIAMMGVLAALYPVLTHDPLSPREKALWVAGFLMLMALEMTIIFKERARQDRAFIAQMGQIQALRELHDAHAVALEGVRSSQKKGSLRDRAFQLSASILDYVQQRLTNAPKGPAQGGAMESNMAAVYQVLQYRTSYEQTFGNWQYQVDTLRNYLDRFSDRVLGICDELKALDLADEQLATMAANPDATNIFVIGRRLGEVADRIKE